MPPLGATRIAPTPSGFLHQGNLVNFLLVSKVAELLRLSLRLRIDDVDRERVRPEYVEDIFRSLDWLGIKPALGPLDAVELAADSQADRADYFFSQLELMAGAGAPVFVCGCSRTMRPAGRCERGCAGRLADFDPYSAGRSTVRCSLAGVEQTLFGQPHRPSYHLVTVVLDRDHRTTHIIRGADLQAASGFHQELSRFLPRALPIKYAHHALLLDAAGAKLSKTNGTRRLALTAELRAQLEQQAESLLPGVLAQF